MLCAGRYSNSWETIFSKSSETISQLELACCRRIVQLCRDCLLIVYQFAAEAKLASPMSTADTAENKHSNRCVNVCAAVVCTRL